MGGTPAAKTALPPPGARDDRGTNRQASSQVYNRWHETQKEGERTMASVTYEHVFKRFG